MKTTSSIHKLNADRKLGAFGRMLWILLNVINNCYFPNRSRSLRIQRFRPQTNERDWARIHTKSSPSRALSDLFWLKLDWEAIRSEVGDICVFDTGAGKGGYALRLNDFSNGIAKYYGVDYERRSNWPALMEAHPFISMQQGSSNAILERIPNDTNFFMSQSAIEHFEDDLHYFEQIRSFINQENRTTIQIHLFPSAACLKLYLWHGIRQYTPRTVQHIVDIFNSPTSYACLYELGGPKCNELHYRFITRPTVFSKEDYRETMSTKYLENLRGAIEGDLASDAGAPSFYALVIHSNFRRRIFESMTDLTGNRID